jgi:hypothetical protein
MPLEHYFQRPHLQKMAHLRVEHIVMEGDAVEDAHDEPLFPLLERPFTESEIAVTDKICAVLDPVHRLKLLLAQQSS